MSKRKKPLLIVRVICLVLLIVLLPFFALCAIIKSIAKLIKYNKYKKNKYTAEDFLKQAEIEYVDVMEGYVFENFLKVMFFYLGYDAVVTKRSGDYGADLVLVKNKQKYVVQAKRYNKNVGSRAVQEVVVAKKHYGADYAMVITNSNFTKQAEEIASENGVALLDRAELRGLILEAKEEIEKNYNLSQEQSEVGLSENFDNKYKFKI